jgi:6-O-methylguanine DNA methyltransferase, DNA binding domain
VLLAPSQVYRIRARAPVTLFLKADAVQKQQLSSIRLAANAPRLHSGRSSSKACSMPKPRKSWREKLNNDQGFPKICPIDEKKSKRWGTGTFVIPAPKEVDQIMRQVPKGKLTTIDQVREILARRHGATIACPITTGIFAWIAAHAANEAESAGKRRFTPYWRTLKSGGELNPKYPGGIAALRRRLASENHHIVQKGKRFFVPDYENVLWKPLTDLSQAQTALR